ncbi:hypothetical protein GQ457_03G003160 [Hibiscus cannabinus]
MFTVLNIIQHDIPPYVISWAQSLLLWTLLLNLRPDWSLNPTPNCVLLEQEGNLVSDFSLVDPWSRYPFRLKCFFFPFVGGGHQIPMIDMARMFAAHGAKSVVIDLFRRLNTLSPFENPSTVTNNPVFGSSSKASRYPT